MKLDLGMLRLDLPEGEDAMAPMMLIAMGDKDEAEKMSVGPTMAKATTHQFRRTLTVNLGNLNEGETPEQGLDRLSKDLVTRVRGRMSSSKPRPKGDRAGLFVEFGHTGQNNAPLRSLTWLVNRDRWVFTFNLTGLDKPKSRAKFDKQMEDLIASVEV